MWLSCRGGRDIVAARAISGGRESGEYQPGDQRGRDANRHPPRRSEPRHTAIFRFTADSVDGWCWPFQPGRRLGNLLRVRWMALLDALPAVQLLVTSTT
jgi:hypothetical protein